MEKTDNKAIISKFMNKEVEAIYKKYLNISQEEEELVANFIRKLEGNKVDFYDPYLDYETTKVLAEDLANEDNIDISKLYIFLKVELRLDIDLEEVQVHYQELQDQGYKQIEDYLFYFDYGESQIESLVEEALEYDLEEVDKAVELFDEEELANMWIFGTSSREAAKQLIEDEGWMEVTKSEDLGTAYKDKYDSEVYYCLNDERRYSFE